MKKKSETPPHSSTVLLRELHSLSCGWGLRGEREGLPSMLATTFAEAAGLAGR